MYDINCNLHISILDKGAGMTEQAQALGRGGVDWLLPRPGGTEDDGRGEWNEGAAREDGSQDPESVKVAESAPELDHPDGVPAESRGPESNASQG